MDLKRINVVVLEEEWRILDDYQREKRLPSKDKSLGELLKEFKKLREAKHGD